VRAIAAAVVGVWWGAIGGWAFGLIGFAIVFAYMSIRE
jgi:hypothetical protein